MITLYRKFVRNCNRLRCKADAIYSLPANHQDWRFRFASVNLISELWQAWCRLCRGVILFSCAGSVRRNGTVLLPRPTDNRWQRIAYEVNEYGHGRIPTRTRICRYLSEEPTWGDTNLLVRSIPHLGISNSAQLITAFGISAQSPSHLQIVRNACYHLNIETMNRVRSLLPFYVGTVRQHPSELIWCLDGNTRCDAFYCWLEELGVIAELAT
jgi:hypothetical protein